MLGPEGAVVSRPAESNWVECARQIRGATSFGVTTMSTKTCPHCGQTLSPNDPAGLCPTCLLQQVMSGGDDSPAPPMAPGDGLFRYTMSKVHWPGGMGEVWLAHDSDMERQVAFKVLKPERVRDPDAVRRFFNEARVTGRLEHPNIVPIYELGSRPGDGTPYYTMRWLRGRTLREAIVEYHRRASKSNPVGFRGLLQAFISVCNAVAFAHDRGVIHRDLKPENVMLGGFGEVVLLDWGLARAADNEARDVTADADTVPGATRGEPVSTAPPDGSEPSSTQPVNDAATPTPHCDSAAPRPDILASTDAVPQDPAARKFEREFRTADNVVLGTVAYMSPEQAGAMGGRVDRRTDVYGLGAMLFTLLTGRPPHTGTTPSDVLVRIIEGPTPSPHGVRPNVPRALAAICERAMAKDAAGRYDSAQSLAQDVERWLADEPVSVYRDPLSVRAVRWVRRHRTLVVASGSTVGVVTVAISVVAILMSSLKQERTRAENVQFELAQVRSESGRFLSTIGQIDKADSEFVASIAQLESLLARSDDTRFLDEQARSWNELGRLRSLASDERGIEAFQQSSEIHRRLASDHPDLPRYALAHAQSLGNEAINYRRLNQIEPAKRSHAAMFAVLQRLVRDYPNDMSYRSTLATAHSNYGVMLKQLGNLTEAEAAYRESLALREKLAAAAPSGFEYRDDVAASLSNLALLWVDQRQPRLRSDEAIDAMQKAVAMREKLWNATQKIEFGISLATSYSNLGGVVAIAKGAEGPAASVPWLEKSVALCRELLVRSPGDPRVLSIQSKGQAILDAARPEPKPMP
jgi:serine/threonine protein kinase